ncbi:MAG: hypothetical protein LBG88_03885 [Christensenellaceae bacterium]|jgi:hypothetical protein|nr:hypothetical protein [Christensenellaceae bacterium]
MERKKMNNKLKKFIGLGLLAFMTCKELPVTQDDITQHLGRGETVLFDDMSQFFENLPKRESEINDAQVKVINDFKNTITKSGRQDDRLRKMGFCIDCIEEDSLPNIIKIAFGQAGPGYGSFSFDTGEMSVARYTVKYDGERLNFESIGARSMAKTALHEFSHAAFGYGEDSAVLFSEVVTDTLDEPEQSEHYYPRDDWYYGSYQLRGAWNQAKLRGQEPKFWESLSSEETMRDMWNSLSPQRKVRGKDVPILNFDDWQLIRATSRSASQFKKNYERISLNLEKAYTSNNPLLQLSLQSEIQKITSYARSVGMVQSNATYKYKLEEQGRRTPVCEHGIDDEHLQ